MSGYIIVGLVCLFGGGALGYLIGGKVKAAAIAAGTAVQSGVQAVKAAASDPKK